MKKRIKVLHVVGARPNFMKVAPLLREFGKHPENAQALLLHTGQHYDDTMSQVFLTQLGMPEPDIYLGVGSGSHAQQTAKIMTAFEDVLVSERPDLVVVVGDVNSTMACTLVAAKLLIRVAHVEAGLRSFDRTMPEEINRVVTDAVADILFTTSEDANQNLLREGIDETKIVLVGNTMIDTLLTVRPHLDNASIRRTLHLGNGPYGYITLHRPSNVDEKSVLAGICSAFEALQDQITLVWLVHPRTRKMLQRFDLEDRMRRLPNIRLTDPLGYIESMSLLSCALFALTDSGGVQEETTVLGIPCLTMRFNTERPVTITDGTNELIGNTPEVIREKTLPLLNGVPRQAARMPKLWDGRASERIVSVLLQRFAID